MNYINYIKHQSKLITEIITDPDKLAATLCFANVVHDSEIVIRGILKTSDAKYIFTPLSFFGVGEIVLSIHNIATAILGSRGATNDTKIEAALTFGAEVGSIGFSLESVAESLESVGAISNSMTWLRPILIASVALQTLGIALDTKNLFETQAVHVKFNSKSLFDKNKHRDVYTQYQKLVSHIVIQRKQEANFVSKYLDVDEVQFANRMQQDVKKIEEIRSQAIDQPLDSALSYENALTKKITAIKERISLKKWSHALNILAATVSLVGAVIILFSSFALLGTGLMVVGALTSLGVLIHKLRMKIIFEKTMAAA